MTWACLDPTVLSDQGSGRAPLAERIASAKSLGVEDAETPNDSEPLSTLHLDVYATKNGPWNPEHGDIEIPADWDFLPSGDAFLTRTVKAAGTYWLSWQPRSRKRQHRRLLGLWAPSQAIAAALLRAEETAARRAAKRDLGAESRRLQEDRYRDELEVAIVRFLVFWPAPPRTRTADCQRDRSPCSRRGQRPSRSDPEAHPRRSSCSQRPGLHQAPLHELPRRSRIAVAGALGRAVLVPRDQRGSERSGRPLPPGASPSLRLPVRSCRMGLPSPSVTACRRGGVLGRLSQPFTWRVSRAGPACPRI